MWKALLAVAVTAAAAASPRPDPVKQLPDSYRLQFENEWVRIVRVTYGPFAKLPAHDHPTFATAYVYLNDAGPVIFRHMDRNGFAVTRPATRAGSFRLLYATRESHEVENTTATPSEFLRVEFKTEPKDARTLRGRFRREDAAAGEHLERVQFENDQVRITRGVCVPGRTVTIEATADPALLIALTPARFEAARGSEASSTDAVLAIGQERWIAAGGREALTNRGTSPAELLRFDFKTRPLE
jgi:hypothetical protein